MLTIVPPILFNINFLYINPNITGETRYRMLL